MLDIFQVETDDHRRQVKELFVEYLDWANSSLKREFGVQFDIAAMVERDMANLDIFCPPQGRLLIARYDNRLAGLACLKQIGDAVGEVKRMYVRPAVRGKGIGRSLLERLIGEARQIGYASIRLDSTRFMTAAHALYRSAGFKEIEPYAESEIPPEYWPHWIFMELALD